MSLDPRAIHIFTDGSCYKNPGGKSGCAAVVHYPDLSPIPVCDPHPFSEIIIFALSEGLKPVGMTPVPAQQLPAQSGSGAPVQPCQPADNKK